MSDLIPQDNIPFHQRLRDKLQAKFGVPPNSTALVLDVSGSMCGGPFKKMQELAATFKGVRRIVFSDNAVEIGPDQKVPFLNSGTDMANAFWFCKTKSIRHVVLLTDGEPNDEMQALREAAGLKIDIFYIGPPPAPPFLLKLAGYTGGSYGETSIFLTKELEDKIRGLLPSPKNAIEL